MAELFRLWWCNAILAECIRIFTTWQAIPFKRKFYFSLEVKFVWTFGFPKQVFIITKKLVQFLNYANNQQHREISVWYLTLLNFNVGLRLVKRHSKMFVLAMISFSKSHTEALSSWSNPISLFCNDGMVHSMCQCCRHNCNETCPKTHHFVQYELRRYSNNICRASEHSNVKGRHDKMAHVKQKLSAQQETHRSRTHHPITRNIL